MPIRALTFNPRRTMSTPAPGGNNVYNVVAARPTNEYGQSQAFANRRHQRQ